MIPTCPLCFNSAAELHHADGRRRFFRCPECTLIYLDPARRLSADEERARYELHENHPDDQEYVDFLRRLADLLIERVAAGAHGLDFGCGPTPVLSQILTAAGLPCGSYDPLFVPDEGALARDYDFIACSEVVEHAYDPADMFALLKQLLARGGVLGVMTRFYGHDAPFGQWWYRRDPTHVCFYAEPTMQWIAQRHGWSVEFPRPHVALFGVPAARS